MANHGTTGPCFGNICIDLWKSLVTDLLDPYRPELHYMRGPGPKWQEKYGPERALLLSGRELPRAAG